MSWFTRIIVPSPTAFSLQAAMQSVFLESFSPNLSSSIVNTMLTLNGAGFTSASVVRMTSPSGASYAAQSVVAITTTQLQAVFPSNSVPAGVYQVCVSSGTSAACGTNTLTMVAMGVPNLVTQIIPPSRVGYHQPATILVKYSNTGNGVMPAPVLYVTATQNGHQGAFLSLDQSALATAAVSIPISALAVGQTSPASKTRWLFSPAVRLLDSTTRRIGERSRLLRRLAAESQLVSKFLSVWLGFQLRGNQFSP